ncbi:hypothetical protein [Anditalea andensis]|uniref:Uncharacterized protein n=1 Tax=Anditalea andensis TaxID=1048983 RepID=A0A074LMQ2_9BACT|nr:hypothetical protein [Anditalea andensis]KEO75157.1 hypothetical protein EL17_05670 [Anditalea andensis]
METLFSLFLFTVSYSLLILSTFPDEYFMSANKNAPLISRYAHTVPILISFLGGYSIAAIVVNIFI